AGDGVGQRVAGAGQIAGTCEDQRFHIGGERVAERGADGVVAAGRERFDHDVTGFADIIEVVAVAAVHRVLAVAAVERVVAVAAVQRVGPVEAGQQVGPGVAGDDVVGGVTGSGRVEKSGDHKVFKLGAQDVAEVGLDRVGAGRGGLD